MGDRGDELGHCDEHGLLEVGSYQQSIVDTQAGEQAQGHIPVQILGEVVVAGQVQDIHLLNRSLTTILRRIQQSITESK